MVSRTPLRAKLAHVVGHLPGVTDCGERVTYDCGDLHEPHAKDRFCQNSEKYGGRNNAAPEALREILTKGIASRLCPFLPLPQMRGFVAVLKWASEEERNRKQREALKPLLRQSLMAINVHRLSK